MNLHYCVNAAGIAALSAASVAATLWLAGADDAAPDPARAPAESDKREHAAAPTFGVLSPASAQAGATGRWVGWMDLGSGDPVAFRFKLTAANGLLTGTATFPIGESAIENGTIQGVQLTFTTRHRNASTGQLIWTKVSGKLDGDTIELGITSEGALSRVLVNRVSP